MEEHFLSKVSLLQPTALLILDIFQRFGLGLKQSFTKCIEERAGRVA